MRIAVVSPYFLDWFGGVQNLAVELVNRLRERSHDAWLVAPGVNERCGAFLLGPVTRLPFNGSVAPVVLDPRVIPRAIAATRDAEVIHLHEPFVPLVSLGLLSRSKIPMVGIFHACPNAKNRRTFSIIQVAPCSLNAVRPQRRGCK